jgi:TldD protein
MVMTANIDLVEQELFQPTGLSRTQVVSVLNSLSDRAIDYADCYFQLSTSESWIMEGGLVKEGAFSISRGVGVRAITGEKTGFAYVDEIALPSLQKSAAAAKSIAHQGRSLNVKAPMIRPLKSLYSSLNPINTLTEKDKIDLLEKIDRYVRAQDSRVVEVIGSIHGSYDLILVAGTDGTYAADRRPLVRMNVSVIVEQNGKREQGYGGGGSRASYDVFLNNEVWKQYAHEALRTALTNLEAIDIKAGVMDIVLGPGWPGILLHEAVGHGLEGDFNRKKTSSFSKLLGKRVGSPLCTVVDDGSLPHRRGSLSIDDEGTPSQCTTLIEKGILVDYIQDKHNAMLMGRSPTGNGRRESYSSLPMPRMTNTYMLPGEHTSEEIIASVKNGLYAVNFNGGQVDITSGKFVFVVSEAYLIENGRLGAPIKGATLIGDGPTALHAISMVGNDLALDEGVGVCGKDGQSVPVGVGQPTVRINGMTVGGAE